MGFISQSVLFEVPTIQQNDGINLTMAEANLKDCRQAAPSPLKNSPSVT